jgi:pyruvate dehydrogenase E1 component alpha subunit
MGIPAVEVDGMDVLAVYRAARGFVERARRGEGPAVLVAHNYRHGGHHVGDPGTRYRSKEEVEEWRRRDPIPRFEKVLIERQALSPGEIEEWHDRVEKRLQAAVEAARNDPYPDVSEVTQHVYA